MNAQEIEIEIERRLTERRQSLDDAIDATLSIDDVRELKKIASYSRVGKIIAGAFITLGSVALGIVEAYRAAKGV